MLKYSKMLGDMVLASLVEGRTLCRLGGNQDIDVALGKSYAKFA
jgi:hypothetical protein